MKAQVIALLTATSIVSAHADAVPPLVEKVASEQSVPSDIFYALLLAESQSKTQQGHKPWPWVINYRGHPHFFPTKADAYAFTSTLVEQGDYAFDVGIAQINWRWHRERFNYDLWSAFDPYTNMSAAAKHLREQYERPECNNWSVAIGCYHRPARSDADIKIANKYANRVIDIWESKFL